jgi:hypothetical protein
MTQQFPQQQPEHPQYPYQQPQQYAPPPPPPKRPWYKRTWSWYRARSRRTQIIIAVVIILFILFGIISALTPQTPSQDTTAAPTQQATQQDAQSQAPVAGACGSNCGPPPAPTQAPAQPTATTQPSQAATTVSSPGQAVLGGPLSAFIDKFGQPNDHSVAYGPHLARCNGSNIDELLLSQLSSQQTAGPITSILFQTCPGTDNSVSTVEAECSAFFPSDAVYQKTVTIVGSSSQLPASDKIYYSATLANEFSADNFTDANQNPVKPGLFDANYLYASDASHIDSCNIALGTQQTQ